jgi:molecular chaperone GrpE
MKSQDHNSKEDSDRIKEIELRQNLLKPADLNRDIDELREQLDQERDRHLRVLADFKNYRRRVEREGNKIAQAGKREIILQVLDVLDDFERTLQWTTNRDRQFMDGVRLIYHKLLTVLENQGVHPFESVGKPFTPDLHDAVAATKEEDVEPGTIIEEFSRGYLWNNELLRSAQVRVAK